MKSYPLGADSSGIAKVETTFRKRYLSDHNLRDPEVWGTAAAMQEAVRRALVRVWGDVFRKAPVTAGRLSGGLGLRRRRDLPAELADPRHTLEGSTSEPTG